MKATKKEINMRVDKELQQRILKYFCWGMGKLTFWMAMFIQLIFYVIRGY